jgi:ribosomal protein L2
MRFLRIRKHNNMAQKKFIIDAGFKSNGDSIIEGNLNVNSTPTEGSHAVTKAYVDGAVANASGGSSGNTADITATGTLPNGAPVILKADGTIEAVGGIVTSFAESIPAGSEVVFNAGGAWAMSAAFDPSTAGQFVLCYKDQGNSNKGTAIIGTVSGTSISFGSEYVFNSGGNDYISAAFDPNTAGQFVVCYDHSGYGKACVGTISGTSISFGSESVFNSGGTQYTSATFDPNDSGKFVVCYRDTGNSDKGTAIVGTISGTSIGFGSEVVFNPWDAQSTSASFDPNASGKFVVCYAAANNSNYGTAIVGTVSGTSISFSPEHVFNTGGTSSISVAFDPNNSGQFVVCYEDFGNSNYGTAIVGTVSGTSISFGSEVVFNSGYTYYMSASFDPNNSGQFVVCYVDGGNSSYGTACVGTVSGTSISFGSEAVLSSGATYVYSVAFDPNDSGKFVVCYTDAGNYNYGTAIVGQLDAQAVTTNLTSDNFIGLATDAYADGETATVTLQGGVSSNQTGLTAGSTYYVQGDGTLATTPIVPNVEVGKAVTPTTLLLKGL